jgi:parallel beta-helix repeat protein
MTTWYFDSANGSDSNDGRSTSTPKQYYSAFSLPSASAGDTFLFKRGTEQIITVAFRGVKNGSSDTVRTRYGAYGEAQVPYSIWKYGASSGNMILNAGQSKYIDFEDMYFDMRNTNCRNAVYCAAQGAVATIGNSFRRCFFQGSNNPVTRGGNGLTLSRESTATACPQYYIIEDCEFFDNEEHGLFLGGSQNIIVRRCKFYRNGQYSLTGGHGFSAGASMTIASAGWTNAGGTVWQRPLAPAELDVYYILTSAPNYSRVRRTAGVATVPGAGEYGVSGGSLYINLNSASNPGTQGVVYAWGKCGGHIVEQCESYENYWNPAALYHEGHGFAFDDFTDDSVFIANKSFNNQGAGFSVNRGDRNVLIGNIAYGNWQSGSVSNPTDGTRVINNTFYGNNIGGGALPGEIVFNGLCRDVVISNNIIISNVAYGISRETTDIGFSGTKNNILMTRGGRAEKNAAVTNTVSVAPQLDSLHRPQADELKRSGEYLGGKDFYGKRFYNPPNIGAVDDVSATPRYLLRSPKPI